MPNDVNKKIPSDQGRQVRLVNNFYTTPLKKNVMELTKDIDTKKLKQNLNNLSIIEILKKSYLSLFSNHF